MNLKVLNTSAVFTSGKDGYHTYRIPALVVTPSGEALAFCEGRRDGQGDQGVIDLLLKRSADGGRSWSKQSIVHQDRSEPDITIGNPCPIVDEQDGTVHLLFTRNNERLFYTKSRDAGQTWSTPVEHTPILDTLDFPWRRIATGPVHGIQTRDGRLLAPIWVCDQTIETLHAGRASAEYRAGVLYSNDHGATWHAGGLTPDSIPNQNECTLAEWRKGTLLLNSRAHRLGCRVQTSSADGGLSWSEPVRMETLPCPTCQGALLGTKGKGLFFLNPAVSYTEGYSAQARRNLTLRRSIDGGRTWPDSLVLYPGPAGYSDLAAFPDGSLLCLVESGVNDYQESITAFSLQLPS